MKGERVRSIVLMSIVGTGLNLNKVQYTDDWM